MPFEQKTSEYIQDNYFFAHFVNRKLALYNNSRAVVCFPGGFGTADEFFEVWVWTQTKGINLVLVGKDFWLPILKKFEERWTRSGLSEKYVGTSRPFLTDDPAEAIRFIEAQTVYNPITDDKSDQSAIGEIRYGLRTVKHWPAATTIMGSMPEGSREFRTLGSLAQAMNARGMPMRVATKDAGVNSAILQALGETQWRDHVQAIVHRQSEVNMTSVLRRLRRHFSCRDMANYDVLYSENSQGDIFLPGGTKIVSRFLHRLNEMQTGMAPVRPIVLIGRRFWTPILKMLSKQMNGFNPPLIKPKDMTLFVVTDSVRGAMDALMGSDSVPKATAAPGGARLAAQGESSGYRFQRPGTAQEPLKVVLIMPRSFSDTQSALPTRLPLSIMSVASCLKNPEFMRKIASSSKFAADLAHVPVIEPILIDLQAEAADFDLEKRLREINPDLVGVSAVTPFFPAAVDVLRIAERAAPQALRVTGGVHISALFKQSRPAFRLAMESSPSQMAVIGEGEEALAEAIVRIANGADLRGAPGFAFKDSANPAQIEEGPPGTRRIDWNEYPPVASSLGLLRLEGYQKWDTVAGYSFPAAAIMTVRGCRYRCKFCASKSTINGPVIALSADSIFKEMKAYYDAGFRFFFFVDDDFLIEHERFRQLALKIRQAGWSIGFNIMTRGDSVTDEMARLLKETGCTITALGAESGDQKLLDAVGKREKLETIAEATQILQRHKLHVRHYYMVGLPGQDWASILQTAEFIVKTRPDTANVSVALPYPGSDYFAKNAIEV
ncbi:MAG: LOG family protein, partial [Candidatus Omnitrophota bacterium]